MGLVPLSRLPPVSDYNSLQRDVEILTIAPYLKDGFSALAAAASLESRKSRWRNETERESLRAISKDVSHLPILARG